MAFTLSISRNESIQIMSRNFAVPLCSESRSVFYSISFMLDDFENCLQIGYTSVLLYKLLELLWVKEIQATCINITK